MITIETKEQPLDTDTKRFYFPAIVTARCPKCNAKVTRDFSNNYLSYPTMNKPMDVTLYHENDDGPYWHHEWTVRLVLRVTLEVAEDQP